MLIRDAILGCCANKELPFWQASHEEIIRIHSALFSAQDIAPADGSQGQLAQMVSFGISSRFEREIGFGGIF